MPSIVEATTSAELDDVRSLMRAFVGWHRQRHVEDLELIDRYFDEKAFDAELAGLPGKYAPPDGCLLVAYHDLQPAGCVAMRDLGSGSCEMKRMFVPAACRGLGIGTALASQLLSQARLARYDRVRLDTSKRQSEAIHLYQKLGFRVIEPYYDVSPEMRDWLVFFELTF